MKVFDRIPSAARRSLVLLASTWLFNASAIAQSGGGYDMKWNSIDGGAQTSTAGNFKLIGTIGQADANRMQGGSFTFLGGFVQSTVQTRCYESAQPVTDSFPKNRYVSILAGDAGRSQAIRVRFVDLPPPFDVWNFANLGTDFFVGEPVQRCENGGEVLFSCIAGICENTPPGRVCSTDVDCCGAAGPLPRNWFWVAPLECDPQDAHKMDWHGECNGGTCVGGLLEGDNCALDEDCVDVVHLFHEGFIPDGVYDVQVVDSSCSFQEEGSYSTPLTMTQARWGDLCSDGPGGACTGVADGNPEVIQDVLGLIDKFQNINARRSVRAGVGLFWLFTLVGSVISSASSRLSSTQNASDRLMRPLVRLAGLGWDATAGQRLRDLL